MFHVTVIMTVNGPVGCAFRQKHQKVNILILRAFLCNIKHWQNRYTVSNLSGGACFYPHQAA